jgi:hypothetical protein
MQISALLRRWFWVRVPVNPLAKSSLGTDLRAVSEEKLKSLARAVFAKVADLANLPW